MNASLDCSAVDPSTVEEGMTLVSRVVNLNVQDKSAIVYPVPMNMNLEYNPPPSGATTAGRRRLLQQTPGTSPAPSNSTPTNLKVSAKRSVRFEPPI